MAVDGFAEEMPAVREAERDHLTGRRRYFRRYRVITDDKFDGPAVVFNAPGLPQRGMPYSTRSENDPAAKVVRHRIVEARESWNVWYVDVDYDTIRPPDNNPLDDPPDIIVTKEHYRKLIPGRFVDGYQQGGDPESVNQKIYIPATNSAGQPFEPPLDYPASRPLVIITRNEAAFDLRITERFSDSVNAENWGGVKKHHAFMRGIDARRVYTPGENNDSPNFLFWVVTYEIAINREGWDIHRLDVGNYYYNLGDDGERKGRAVPFKADGLNVLGYLDGDKGGKLPATDKEPKYMVFKDAIKEEQWSLLSLPTDINTEAYARPAERRNKND